MTKRKFGLGLSLVLAAGTILGACGTKDDEKASTGSEGADKGTESTDFSIAMITDVGGVDDKSFNQSAWEGFQAWGKEHGLEKGDGGFDYLQSAGDADYVTNLNNLVRRDFDIVYGIGFLLEEPIATIADQKPDNKFVILDGVADRPNVVSVLFKEQEVAYLAGVAAALMSETKQVGFVGGMEIPVIERFEAGFVEGVKAVDPSIKVDVQYTGKFDDAALGKTTANRMYSSGVDIIAHAAGGTGNGVFAEAKERKTKDPNANVWVIGVDSDQYEEGAVGDSNVTLTSMLKKVGTAVQDVANDAMAGNFPGGTTLTYGLAENGVELADSRGAIPQEILDQIKEYSDKVASGEITVPETVE
ncbi:BMP family lipoprotein [Psychrobacillus lasiicapitis]|uniref:BMP family ABC transporter substrate-binding protein n=1 Tax=Psychrobacillus lasiicapitis TaxID=1636719 RepID=A0A544STJ9_9BACI|nr:BMP family protein [Psychrobacillus lasiicapitis]TQR08455.1 BMP family ABC transporter substrate-binding protein [Psychrobacillus lasiicapitis]GGA15749.1 putative lipoprotein YufN [Psychrobacillus lasiicapitis]